MSAQLKIVEKPTRPVSDWRDRRKSKRSMVAVRARICGDIGTMHVFEETVTCLDISRDGLRIPTARPGYVPGQMLHVTCPYWDAPTAINRPRIAKVLRCKITPNLGYEVALQFLPDDAEDAPLLRHRAHNAAGQVRVLIVESDLRVSSALRELLEKDGYHVVTVEKPAHALAVIQAEAPHVIVAEVEGHEISGHDLCAIVKTTARLQHIPVILLTSSALPSDYASSHLIGAIVCITKPYKLDCVRHAVRLVASPPSQASAYSAAFNVSAFVRTS